jgi:hypothetical protein
MAHKPAVRIYLGEIIQDQSLIAAGIIGEELFGSPEVGKQEISVSPGIDSSEAFGTPSLIPVISPSGITTSEAFGSPGVLGHTTLLPAGIPSEESPGTPRLDLNLQVSSIPPGENFGVPAFIYIVRPEGVWSGEAFGIAGMVFDQFLAVTGIPSAERCGGHLIKVPAGYVNVFNKIQVPPGFRFGLKRLKDLGSVSAGLKSKFKLTPLKAVTETETAGVVYTVKVMDTFAGTDWDLLKGHQPDIGNPWDTSNPVQPRILSNMVKNSEAGYSICLQGLSSSNGSYVKMKIMSGIYSGRIMMRYDDVSQYQISASFYSVSGTIILFGLSDDPEVYVQTIHRALSIGDELKLLISGGPSAAAITVFINDEIIFEGQGPVPPSGDCGFLIDGTSTILDDFEFGEAL